MQPERSADGRPIAVCGSPAGLRAISVPPATASSSPGRRPANRPPGSIAALARASPARPSAVRSRMPRSRASGCRRSRRWRSSRATTSRPSPTRPRPSCSPCWPPGRDAFGLAVPISALIVARPWHHRRLVSPDDPCLPQRRRQLHRRAGEPRDGRGPGRGRRAPHRLRPDGLCERRRRASRPSPRPSRASSTACASRSPR